MPRHNNGGQRHHNGSFKFGKIKPKMAKATAKMSGQEQNQHNFLNNGFNNNGYVFQGFRFNLERSLNC
jgi:hypothetical protein